MSSWILTKYPLQVMLVAKREILFLDSLRPVGFGDEAYRTIFRLRLKIFNLLALFQACYLVTISKRSFVLRLQVHIRALLSGYRTDHLITHYVFRDFFGIPDTLQPSLPRDPGWKKREETLGYVLNDK